MRGASSLCRLALVAASALRAARSQNTAADADITTVCPDGNHCKGGSRCTLTGRINNATGLVEHGCDCSGITGGTPCEPASDVFCVKGPLPPDPMAKESYCVNQGACTTTTEVDDNGSFERVGCKCTEDYEGDHCQVRKGATPSGVGNDEQDNGTTETDANPRGDMDPDAGIRGTDTASAGGGGGLSGGAIAGIVVGSLVAVCCLAAVLFAVFQRRGDDPPSVVVEEDGGAYERDSN